VKQNHNRDIVGLKGVCGDLRHRTIASLHDLDVQCSLGTRGETTEWLECRQSISTGYRTVAAKVPRDSGEGVSYAECHWM
jgi:hypothetical protein